MSDFRRRLAAVERALWGTDRTYTARAEVLAMRAYLFTDGADLQRVIESLPPSPARDFLFGGLHSNGNAIE
jgi:hypothetical protein